ncbi:MAG: GNAT family N-acetyltransferase [Acetatifactor sp.]|nr:GNAT family N-acetyltransferase [Acetatifactor sp.]
MEFATYDDEAAILDFYQKVIEAVNASPIRLGWNIENYPNQEFIHGAISKKEICILREEGQIIAAAVVNHEVNPEYDDIQWTICGPKEKVATIHALAVAPDRRGGKVSDQMLSELEKLCRRNGDLAIHLDVIDTNVPAYKLYLRNGYQEVDCIKMYYEVVGTREFWMMEKVLS